MLKEVLFLGEIVVITMKWADSLDITKELESINSIASDTIKGAHCQ